MNTQPHHQQQQLQPVQNVSRTYNGQSSRGRGRGGYRNNYVPTGHQSYGPKISYRYPHGGNQSRVFMNANPNLSQISSTPVAPVPLSLAPAPAGQGHQSQFPISSTPYMDENPVLMPTPQNVVPANNWQPTAGPSSTALQPIEPSNLELSSCSSNDSGINMSFSPQQMQPLPPPAPLHNYFPLLQSHGHGAYFMPHNPIQFYPFPNFLLPQQFMANSFNSAAYPNIPNLQQIPIRYGPPHVPASASAPAPAPAPAPAVTQYICSKCQRKIPPTELTDASTMTEQPQ